MTPLEDILRESVLAGVIPNKCITVKEKLRRDADHLKIWYTDDDGNDGCTTLTRSHERMIETIKDGMPIGANRHALYPLYDLIQNSIFTAPLSLEAAFVDDGGVRHAFKGCVRRDGSVLVNYKLFDTLKGAANEVLKHLRLDAGAMHKPVVVQDGWDFWQFTDDDGTLCYMHVLRDRFEELRRTSQ